MGDLPFYPARGGADVAARPELFRLDASGHPTHVAGVPPDYFSEEGQLWGNPLYRWEAHERERFAWWIDRLQAALEIADLVRLDHFRAFAACWEVEADAPNAAGGRWTPGPGRRLFDAVEAAIGSLPFIAEDLGTITDDVVALRKSLSLPGMRVLQFAFGEDDGWTHSHANPETDAVAYTGTHDNDTFRGWFDSLAPAPRARVLQELGAGPREVVDRAIELLYRSAAQMVVVPPAGRPRPRQRRADEPARIDGAELEVACRARLLHTA